MVFVCANPHRQPRMAARKGYIRQNVLFVGHYLACTAVVDYVQTVIAAIQEAQNEHCFSTFSQSGSGFSMERVGVVR